MEELTLQEIAKTPVARFQWWVQTKFAILPTDPRYKQLTEEQWQLMWEHYKLDNPLPEEEPNNKYKDPDYDEEAEKVDGEHSEEITDSEHRLPMQDHEHYEDPDFDAVWNADDEDFDNEFIDENQQENDFETIGDETLTEEQQRKTSYDDNEWEEV